MSGRSVRPAGRRLVAAGALLLMGSTVASCSGPSSAPVPSTSATTLPPTTTTTQTLPTTSAVGFRAVADGIGDPYYPALGNRGYDVIHYLVAITADPASPVITGTTEIEAVATDGLDTFNLDLVGFEIVELTVDGAPAQHARTGEELTIRPLQPIGAGATFTTSITYRGDALPRESRAIGFPVGWNRVGTVASFVVAEPDGARNWFPVNDHPLDKATYRFEITVPEPLTAAANGVLVDTLTDLGSSTWIWAMDDPMASYLATVVIGDYLVVPDPVASAAAGFPVRHVLPPAVAAEPPDALNRIGAAAAFFAERFGPYPHDAWGIALVAGFPAALENQTLAIVSADLLDADILENFIVHELAHEWFGNSVSPGAWRDIWLNEGFASYAEWLWFEHRFGTAAFEARVASEYAGLLEASLDPPGTPPPDDLFNRSVYRRGALTLHALRRTVGDEVFFRILRLHHAEHAGSTATTEDFVALATGVGGESLRTLLESWLYDEQMPSLDG